MFYHGNYKIPLKDFMQEIVMMQSIFLNIIMEDFLLNWARLGFGEKRTDKNWEYW